MSIKYFYNICITGLDDTVLKDDILSAIRKSYFNDFDKIRDKITVDSEGEFLLYDYCIEKEKPLRWAVITSKGDVVQDVSPAESGRYYICFYKDDRLIKRLLFSKLHTLLRAEYTDKSGAVCASLEPRKLRDGLCLLYKSKHLPSAQVLTQMPDISDERVLARVIDEFKDHTASASTNEGVVMYLTDEQLTAFNTFVTQIQKELEEITEETFIGDQMPLLDKINIKDFNVKRNLSSSLDITKARDFGKPKAEVKVEPVIDRSVDEHDRYSADETEISVDSPDVQTDKDAVELDMEISTDDIVQDTNKPDKLIMADGAVYCYYGDLDETGNRSGYGRTVTELGMTAYEGSYLNDKRSGKGVYFYKDGSLCYSGDWAENARHGIGVGVSARDGSMHIGRWINNKPEGNGVRLSADGDIKFVCKELDDGSTVLMNYTDDNGVVISKYDENGNKTDEKTVSLIDF